MRNAIIILLFCLWANALPAQGDSNIPPPPSTRYDYIPMEKSVWDNPVVEKIHYEYSYGKRAYAKQIAVARPVLLVLCVASIMMAFRPARQSDTILPDS